MNLLRVENISMSYGNHKVLSGGYFSMPCGSINSIVGLNGSGKTTFIKAMAGLLRESRENLFLRGNFIPGNRRMKYTAYLSQDSFLPSNERVGKIIKILLSGSPRSNILDDERIASLLHCKAAQLSGGERKYLEVLLITSLERDIYIFDEPFIEIEPMYMNRVFSRIRALKEKGKYIILTDHNFSLVKKISDQIWLCRDGKLFREDDAELSMIRQNYLPSNQS